MKISIRTFFLWLFLTIIGIILLLLTLMYDIFKDAISNFAQPYITQLSQSVQGKSFWLFLIIVFVTLAGLIVVVTLVQSRLKKIARNKQEEYKLDHPIEYRYLTWIIESFSSEQATFVKPKVSLLTPINYKKAGRKKLNIGKVFQNAFRLPTGFDNLVESEMMRDGYGVIIEGDPGLGKTTCLRRQILNRAKKIVTGEENLPRIPVYIAISDYRGDVPFF